MSQASKSAPLHSKKAHRGPPTPKLALFAITTFVASSATFAIATALAPSGPSFIGPSRGYDAPAEEIVLRQTLDERMHMHLKRLQLPTT